MTKFYEPKTVKAWEGPLVSNDRLVISDFKAIVPKRKKIEIRFVPSELKARYGYSHVMTRLVRVKGLQFDPFEEDDWNE